MPTYNQADFIVESINSVLNQSYSNLELIIVNNFSSDKTDEIIHSFSDQRIRNFKFANQGIIAASRNFGIKNSKGIYISFIDSDDIWLRDKLKFQLDYFKENPEIKLISSSLRISGPDKRYNGIDTFLNGNIRSGFIYEKLLDYNFIPFSSVIIENSVFNETGYFDESPEIMPAEDWDLWLRIARRFQIAFIPKVVGIYRMHNLNHSKNVKKLDKAIYVIEKHIQNKWIAEGQGNRAKSHFYFHEGWFVIEKDNLYSRKLLRKALSLSKNNKKLYFACLLALFLANFPFLCALIKSMMLDRKLGSLIFKIQHF